jgi:ABC-type phosphate transport system ATPase subunit
MRITKAAVKIGLTGGIAAEDRVHRGAMAVKGGPVARAEIARRGIVRPASAVDPVQARAVKAVVANSSDRDAVILIAVNRANAARLRRRCRK